MKYVSNCTFTIIMRYRRRELLLLVLVLLLFIGVLVLLFIGYHLFAPAIDGTHHKYEGQCQYYKDQSFASGEFLAIRAVSSHDCCAVCWQHERCVAWTFHKAACWLKDELTTPFNEPGRGTISGRLIDSSRQALSCMKDHMKHGIIVQPSTNNKTDMCNANVANKSKIIRKRILFTGLAYQINDQQAKIIEKTFNELGSFFTDWQALIYENDVNGESALHRIASSNQHIRLMSETLHFSYSKKMQFQQYCGRPRLMAFLRQRLLLSIQQLFHSSLLSSSSIDLILYFDLDLVGNYGVDVQSLAKRLCQRQYDSWWDVLCGFGRNRNGAYHDTFALRPCDVDFYRKVHHFDRMLTAYPTDFSPFIRPHQGFLRVRSCFGGMTLYRADMLAKTTCQYNDTICMCEHVLFHSCLVHQGYDRIFIDTSMFIGY